MSEEEYDIEVPEDPPNDLYYETFDIPKESINYPEKPQSDQSIKPEE